MLRRMVAGALIVSLAIALGLLGFLAMGGQESAHAQGTVNFDIDPEITGNSANTLGAVENCYAVTCPSVECTWDGSSSFDDVSDYVIDVVVSGDTQAPVSYDASLNYDETRVHVAEPGTDPGVEADGKMPGAFDLSEALPDSDGTFAAGAIDLTGDPGIAGDGTIARVGLDIGASGVVTFSLNEAPLTAYVSELGNHAVTRGTGMLAINEDCYAAVGGIAKLPDVSDSAGWNCVAIAGLAALAVAALGAGGWYVRRRWVR
ncbi:MAG: hypothetical protein JSU97_00495 [Dehalococcoidia bacterium]|nr:MAG: hypothetical protein JSU97_00495 [Dehalococcoidia bacterium]